MKAKKTPVVVDRLYAEARAHRKTLPLDDLADWKPKLRKKSVEQLLKASLKGRLPDLTALRFERMTASAFDFFRGSACVMAYDLSLAANTGIAVQMCGDAHVQNLGAFAGDDGRLIFDINDFDEALRGPFEWELKRMATSIVLAGQDAGLKPAAGEEAAASFLSSYGGLIRVLLPLPVLEVARWQVHRLSSVAPISKILAKAERATPQSLLESLTTLYPKGRVFKSNPPLLRRLEPAEREPVLASLKTYVQTLQPERRRFFARFRAIDVAFKVVGTGSVGMRDYVVYLEGNGPDDPMFLQIKQELSSCWAPYLKQQTSKMQEGRRVVEGQRAMQLQSDPLLGWTSIGRYDYLVRQLNDHKASLNLAGMKAADLCEYAMVCGEILARGHARSGDVRQIAGYVGNGGRFEKAILEFAHAYAGQATADWKRFSTGQKRKPGAG